VVFSTPSLTPRCGFTVKSHFATKSSVQCCRLRHPQNVGAVKLIFSNESSGHPAWSDSWSAGGASAAAAAVAVEMKARRIAAAAAAAAVAGRWCLRMTSAAGVAAAGCCGEAEIDYAQEAEMN
jgi:Na+(H+)/acetate symporter ActP